METKWILNKEVDSQHVAEIMKVLNVDENLATLLVQRGITNYEESKVFFRPSLSQLHDPFLMTDMEKAVERVLRAINDGEKLTLWLCWTSSRAASCRGRGRGCGSRGSRAPSR